MNNDQEVFPRNDFTKTLGGYCLELVFSKIARINWESGWCVYYYYGKTKIESLKLSLVPYVSSSKIQG
jgi:hypothetical protein